MQLLNNIWRCVKGGAARDLRARPYDAGGGYRSAHHRATSSRRMNRTPGCAVACSRNIRIAAARAACPDQRACATTVMNAGRFSASSWSRPMTSVSR